MDIRPHRRIAVPFGPPLFDTLTEVADFVGTNYENFGMCVFSDTALAGAPTRLYRRMCDSLGMKMTVDCRRLVGPDGRMTEEARAATEVADFAIVPAATEDGVVAALAEQMKARNGLVLVPALTAARFGDFIDCVGFVCDRSLVAAGRKCGEDYVILAEGCADEAAVIQAVKDGASHVLVGEFLVKAKSPPEAFRELASKYQEFT